MQIAVRCGKAFDLHTFQAQVIGSLGVEHAVHEHNFETIDGVEKRRLFVFQHRRWNRLGLDQAIGAGKLPIFIAPLGKTHPAQARQSIFPRGDGPSLARHVELGNPRFGGVQFFGCIRHHTASLRMSVYPFSSTSSASSGPPVFTMRPSDMM